MINVIRTLKKNLLDDTIDLAKLSKSFLLWGAGVVFVYIANVFLTRLIGLEQYGQYTVFMNWVALGSTFVTFGWDGYLVQRIPQLTRNSGGAIEAGGLFRRLFMSFIILFIFLAAAVIAGENLGWALPIFEHKYALLCFVLLVGFISI
ncbi:MAG TPA: oligosaccharide flippase family protein, partial [Ferruginibacter sp.]|nr:oligosaccharide flippase family protein [Ferruginibacter sp.]